MKTFNDLVEAVRNGARPEVQFTKKIEELEAYPEGNMRATIVGAEHMNHDSVVKLRMDYSKFDEANKALEAHNYYDGNGLATLTAREAGFYTVQEDIYFMGDDLISDYLSEVKADLVKEYQKDVLAPGAEMITYVQWLEERVRELRKLTETHATYQ